MVSRSGQRGTAAAVLVVASGGLVPPSTRAAPPLQPTASRSISKQRVTFLSAPGRGALPVSGGGTGIPTAVDAIQQYGRGLGVTDAPSQLVVGPRTTDRLGHRHTALLQRHQGVKVFTGMLKVHQDDRGDFLSAGGDFYLIDAALLTTATLAVDRAVSIARRNLEMAAPVVSRSDLVIVDPGWYGDPSIGAHLAYHIEIQDAQSATGSALFVDAHGGKVLDRWSPLPTALVRRVFDGRGEDELPGTLARSEGDRAVFTPEDVDRAYDYAGDVYGFLSRALNRDSVNGSGLPLTITVNSTALGCPNAFWEDRLVQSAFCEGTVSDDIVGHEIGHGLTLFAAGLLVQNQPGQINESYADVLGELVDLYNGDVSRPGPPARPSWPFHLTSEGTDLPNRRRTGCSPSPDHADGVRWLVGEDATAFGGPIRDMWDPTCHGHPDRTGSELYTCPPLDNGGVHIGNGVVNHAFAMLVDGKEFNGYTVHAIGPEKAAAVWFRALEHYLTAASNFEDAYHALRRAALDLVGTIPNDPRTGFRTGVLFTAFDAEQVDNALLATQLSAEASCGLQEPRLDSSPAPPCTAGTTLYREDFEGQVVGWTFQNTGPPTPYDWEVTEQPLPFQRAGRALFCADAHFDDCATADESAAHYAISPVIEIPPTSATPMLSFRHAFAVETGWDGGHVQIRVNGGGWTTIPPGTFRFNPYNARLRSAQQENTNPLAGELGWSGASGGWGTTLVDLGGLVKVGDALEIRFTFGKDRCAGRDGWYVDDVEVFTCPDCNFNGVPDGADLHFTAVAAAEATLGHNQPVSMKLPILRPARSNVTMTVYAAADINDSRESLTIFFNDAAVGVVFDRHGDALDCPAVADRDVLVLPRETFNNLLTKEAATIDVVASRNVSPSLCVDGTFVQVMLDYTAATSDNNDNGIPDECEGCALPVAPLVAPGEVAKNRYVSFAPPPTNRLIGLRVDVAMAPAGFEAIVGKTLWVDQPFRAESDTGRLHGYARLRCEPLFFDWSGFDVVHVGDANVVPGSVLELSAIDLACAGDPDDPFFTESLVLRTVAAWGDLVGGTALLPPGDGPTVTDVVAIVDALRREGAVIGRARADLLPATPDLAVTVQEVVAVVDAVTGDSFPYPAPEGCP